MWYGRNSIYIICFHYFERMIIQYNKIGIHTTCQLFIAKIVIITFLTYLLINITKLIKNNANRVESKEKLGGDK